MKFDIRKYRDVLKKQTFTLTSKILYFPLVGTRPETEELDYRKEKGGIILIADNHKSLSSMIDSLCEVNNFPDLKNNKNAKYITNLKLQRMQRFYNKW